VLGLEDTDAAAEAEEVWKKVGWKAGLRFPPFIHALWRMFPDTASINKDITGELALVVGERLGRDSDDGKLVLGNATGLGPTFDALLEESRAAA
jgi:hypothetical protein